MKVTATELAFVRSMGLYVTDAARSSACRMMIGNRGDYH
jgi:hypothetical protein